MASKGLKKLASLFVEIQEDKADAKPSVAEAPAAPAPPVQAEEDKGIADTLQKALAGANMEGFDYFEFAQICQQLKPNIPSEEMLFQTAYMSGKVMGATKQKLIQSADHYLQVLGGKQSEFEEAVKEQVDQTVTSLQKELASVDAGMKSKTELIRGLTEEINGLAQRQAKVTSQIAQNKARIEQIRANFAATIARFVQRIKDDGQKIDKYIQEGAANG